MLKEVNVEYDSVPSEAIRSKSDIVDKYAKSTIYPSDFITQEKLSVIDTSSNLYSLKDGETAVSVTMKTLSKSVSGKILIGEQFNYTDMTHRKKKSIQIAGNGTLKFWRLIMPKAKMYPVQT